MPITILEKPEPWSEASRGEVKPILIDSDALNLLVHELRHYCNQELTGRSFLIAGHRGSGKTTLVHAALQQVLEVVTEADRNGAAASRPGLRPLLVLLQGPNLLPGPVERKIELASEMEHILIQITLGLYRSLAHEFAKSFRDQLLIPAPWRRGLPLLDERLELAAQFELDLDEYPGEARLREYWRRCGALQTGVLFASEFGTNLNTPLGHWQTRNARPLDQGFREIVALSSACRAYQRISGTINAKEEKRAGGKTETEGQISIDAKSAELLKPVIAILTGGLAGTGVLAVDPTQYTTAAVVGFAAALAMSVAAKYSASWSHQRSLAREDLFIPNLSVATLDRVLPVLIERIRAAGLAPVFVVDELDKVVGLSDRITEMVRRLKKFVAENAFFCFLADRSYFEEMRGRIAEVAYPPEYTYFTNQVFVVFKHRDLHQYLSDVLERPESESLEEGAEGEPFVADPEASEYSADYPVLPYILLHASQMHPIDVRRQLTAVRNERGEVSLAPGAVRSRPRYRFELMIQVAIETVLEEEEMQAELDRQPAFLRLAHDALYYISRRWEYAPTLLLLNDAGENDFETYLSERMADTSLHKSRRARRSSEIGSTKLHLVQSQVEPAQRRFLMERVRQLAALLASPKTLRERAKKNLPQVVLAALPSDPLLYYVKDKEPVFRWHCYQSGRVIEREGVEEQHPGDVPTDLTWIDNAYFIDEFERKLAEASSGSIELATLSGQFGIIDTTPAWADVKRAISRLRAAKDTDVAYPEQDADVSVLDSFQRLLKRSGNTIALAILCGEAVGAFSPTQGGQGALQGLKVISDAFWFRDMAEDEVSKRLRDLAKQVETELGLALGSQEQLASMASLTSWAQSVTEVRERIMDEIRQSKNDMLMNAKYLSWLLWFIRLQSTRDEDKELRLSDMICARARVGPARYLRFDSDSMALGEWSEALVAAITSKGAGDPDYVPPWLALAALQRLGFDNVRAVNSLLLFSREMSSEEFDSYNGWIAPATREVRRTSALIVGSPARAREWRPSSRYAMIVLSVDSAKKLVAAWQSGRKKILDHLVLDYVALEMPTDPARGGRERVFHEPAMPSEEEGDILEFFNTKEKQKAILVFPDVRSRVPSMRYHAITAKNLDEFFSEAGSQPRESGRSRFEFGA
jgi:hypothetical protein